MRNSYNDIVVCLCFGTLLLHQAILGSGKSCSISNLSDGGCGANESCVAIAAGNSEGRCECNRNYQKQDDKCLPIVTTTQSSIDTSTAKESSADSTNGSSVAAGLLIPIFLISIAVLIVLAARRYKWVQRFRQYQQNRYGTVLVNKDEDDDDDPPIV